MYYLLSVICGLLADAPWDDDCIGRYSNTVNAIHDPKQFISLWNRPLFTLLFFLPMQLGQHAVTFIMPAICIVGAWYLYQSVKLSEIKNTWLVVPFFLFQTYFFSISRQALTEPLAATIIGMGLYFFLKKKYLLFVVIGALLPLARIELSFLFVIWAYLLIKEKQWIYIVFDAYYLILWTFLLLEWSY
jgi:hypothetical protein